MLFTDQMLLLLLLLFVVRRLHSDLLRESSEVDGATIFVILSFSLHHVGKLLHLYRIVLYFILAWARLAITLRHIGVIVLALRPSISPASTLTLWLRQLKLGIIVAWTKCFSEELELLIVGLLLISVEYCAIEFSSIIFRTSFLLFLLFDNLAGNSSILLLN